MPSNLKCLICDIKVEPNTLLSEPKSVDEVSSKVRPRNEKVGSVGGGGGNEIDKSISKTHKRIEKQLHVIFILKNVLELPSETLEHYLNQFGNPEDWIVLCGGCSEVIENVKSIFIELQIISKKYEEVKLDVQEIIRATFKVQRGHVVNVYDDCRSIVGKRDQRQCSAPTSTDHLKWDQLAAELAWKAVAAAESADDDHDDNEAPSNLEDDNENVSDVGESKEVDPLDRDISAPPSPIRSSDKDYKLDGDRSPDSCEDGSSKSYDLSEENDNDNSEADTTYQLRGNRNCRKTRSATATVKQINIKKEPQSEDESDPLQCDHCNEQYPDLKSLQEHKLSNYGELDEKGNHSCIICKRYFKVKLRLHQHVGCHEKHKCQVCGKQETSELNLKKHLLAEHGLPRLDCTVEGCSKVFNRKERLNEHLKLHKDKELALRFDCTYEGCSKFFKRKKTLQGHLKRHAEKELNLKCELCEKRLSSYDNLKLHKFLVHKIGERKGKYYECPDCGVRSLEKGADRIHGRVCPKKTLFPCDICNLKFGSQKELSIHKEMKHSIKQRPENGDDEDDDDDASHSEESGIEDKYPCSHCGKLFLTQKTLRSHERDVHLNARRFTCDIPSCGYGTPYRIQFALHRARKHQIGVEDFKCEKCQHFCENLTEKRKHICNQLKKKIRKKSICKICGKEFNSNLELQNHVTYIHERNFKYNCHLCSSFGGATYKYSLEKHLAFKHGIGDFRCEEEDCSRVFHRQKLLEEHVKYVHKGEPRPKTAICSICRRGFANPVLLRTHFQNMHSESKPYQCEWCGEVFGSANGRCNHKRKCKNKPQD